MSPFTFAKSTTDPTTKRTKLGYVVFFLVYLLLFLLLSFSEEIFEIEHQNRWSSLWSYLIVFVGFLIVIVSIQSRNFTFLVLSVIAVFFSASTLFYISDSLGFEWSGIELLLLLLVSSVWWPLAEFSTAGTLRNMLEVAGRAVRSDQNGYSNRPFPSGNFDYTREEAEAFAKWLHKTFAATSYLQEDKVVLVFNKGWFTYLPLVKPNLERCTYVELDFEGNITVRIAERHYDLYKKELTFDRLCNAVAELIMLCFRYHKEGCPFSIRKELYHFSESSIRGEACQS